MLKNVVVQNELFVPKNYLCKLQSELKHEKTAEGKAEEEDEEEKRIFTGSHGKLILVLE